MNGQTASPAARRRPPPPRLPLDQACAALIVVAAAGLFCFGRAYGTPIALSGVQPIDLIGLAYWCCGGLALLAAWCDGSPTGHRRARRLLLGGAAAGGIALVALAAATVALVANVADPMRAAFSVAAAIAFAMLVRGFLRLVD